MLLESLPLLLKIIQVIIPIRFLFDFPIPRNATDKFVLARETRYEKMEIVVSIRATIFIVLRIFLKKVVVSFDHMY